MESEPEPAIASKNQQKVRESDITNSDLLFSIDWFFNSLDGLLYRKAI